MAVPLNIIKPGDSHSELSGAAIGQYDCVIYSAEGKVVKSDGTNKRGVGFMHTGKATAANEHIDVFTSGIVWARAAAAVTAGAELETAADGEVQDAGVGDFIVGIAKTAAAGANELVAVQIELYEKAAS